ncbi:hypothetical protein HOY80DRAFT_1135815 [Tuber brumale]|nr:hypothetical protein HOY80DRAFT_1135815 [Tuber brumale]
MPVILSELVTRATPRITTSIPSVAHRIKRHYTVEQGSDDAKDGVAGSGGDIDGGGEPLSYSRRVVLLEKRVGTGFDKMESWFKWAGLTNVPVRGKVCLRRFYGNERNLTRKRPDSRRGWGV